MTTPVHLPTYERIGGSFQLLKPQRPGDRPALSFAARRVIDRGGPRPLLTYELRCAVRDRAA